MTPPIGIDLATSSKVYPRWIAETPDSPLPDWAAASSFLPKNTVNAALAAKSTCKHLQSAQPDGLSWSYPCRKNTKIPDRALWRQSAHSAASLEPGSRCRKQCLRQENEASRSSRFGCPFRCLAATKRTSVSDAPSDG